VKVLIWVLVILAGAVIEAELIAWCRPLQRALIRRVAAPLPRQYRDRYVEEWYRELEEIPNGPITRPIWILSLLHRRGSVARALGVHRTVVGFSGALKRLGDIVVASVGLLIIGPVMLYIAAVVKLQDGGPVIFRQTRIGRDGKPFAVLKFRSMVVDAEMRKAVQVAYTAWSEGEEGVGSFSLRFDPLVTRFGQFLRNFSLDKLPQLFNVLAGSMSLVGPRPRELAPDATEKVPVKPGLTGLWQTSGRSNGEDASQLDSEYAKRWSLWLDFKILWRTVKAVLGRRGQVDLSDREDPH
jgi:lipopolysaccharide/colanic/teichoic acid biosynthesis glycosyltransferase